MSASAAHAKRNDRKDAKRGDGKRHAVQQQSPLADSTPTTETVNQAGIPAYLQHKCDACSASASAPDDEMPLQHKKANANGGSAARMHGIASQGTANARSALPHGARIQSAFGRHDVSGVRAQIGGAAEQASTSMGANAYTLGNSIGFKQSPDLRLAAHEAAHVVQQRKGVQLKGGVGRAGDAYERHADAVADRVVQGESAEQLLDVAGGPTKAGLQMDAPPGEDVDPSMGVTAKELVEVFKDDLRGYQNLGGLLVPRGRDFFPIAKMLATVLQIKGAPDDYIREVIKHPYIGSDYEDNLCAEIITLLTDARLDNFARTPRGAAMLDVMREAMATGNVSDYEEEQVGRIDAAKARQQGTATESGPAPKTPAEFIERYEFDLLTGRYDRVALALIPIVKTGYASSNFILALLKDVGSRAADNLSAEILVRMSDKEIDQFRGPMEDGVEAKHALILMYEALITGDVSANEREQAQRIINSKLRLKSAAGYLAERKGGKRLTTGGPMPIFPVRFSGLLRHAWATPHVKLDDKLMVYISYPVHNCANDMFKKECKTFDPMGTTLHPNEIVGVKNYEQDGAPISYMTALQLIDYANQSHNATMGNIITVATLPLGWGAGAAVKGAATLGRAARLGIWFARNADRIQNAIQIAAIFVREQRAWILENLGSTGKVLIDVIETADQVATIYGYAQLGKMGLDMASKLRKSTKEASDAARTLNMDADDIKVFDQLNEQAEQWAKKIDDADAAKKLDDVNAPKSNVDAPGATHVDDAAAARAAKAGDDVDDLLKKGANKIGIPPAKFKLEIDEIRLKADADPKNVTPVRTGGVDAEVKVGPASDRHTYRRDKAERTWCRRSDEKCGVDVGAPTNKSVDNALESAGKPGVLKRKAGTGPKQKPAELETSTRSGSTDEDIADVHAQQTGSTREWDQDEIAGRADDVRSKPHPRTSQSTTKPERDRATAEAERRRNAKEDPEDSGSSAPERPPASAFDDPNFIPPEYMRPKFRPGMRDEVWDAAVERAKKNPPHDGIVRDPLTEKPIDKNSNWHMGHKPGYEFRKHRKSAIERGISREQFKKEFNTADHFHPELPKSNLSHKGEAMDDEYYGY